MNLYLYNNPSWEEKFVEKRDEGGIKIIFLLNGYDGVVGDATWEVFERISEGNVYKMDDLDDEALKKIANIAMNNICQ